MPLHWDSSRLQASRGRIFSEKHCNENRLIQSLCTHPATGRVHAAPVVLVCQSMVGEVRRLVGYCYRYCYIRHALVLGPIQESIMMLFVAAIQTCTFIPQASNRCAFKAHRHPPTDSLGVLTVLASAAFAAALGGAWTRSAGFAMRHAPAPILHRDAYL